MSKLTQEMKDLVSGNQCFIATVNEDGTPEVGPKRSTRVLDDEHLAFNEVTCGATWANVQRGSKVAVAVVDHERRTGFRFFGSPEIVTGGPMFDQAVEAMQKAGLKAPLKAVVTIRVERIYGLGFPGAGKQVA